MAKAERETKGKAYKERLPKDHLRRPKVDELSMQSLAKFPYSPKLDYAYSSLFIENKRFLCRVFLTLFLSNSNSRIYEKKKEDCSSFLPIFN